MRESLASLRAEVVDGAIVAVQEHAAGRSSLQDQLAVGSGLRVLFPELLAGDPQILGKAHDIFFEDLGLGHAAALGALAAVDGCVDFVGLGAELALHEVVGLDPAPELLIFTALLFAQARDLYQVGYHWVP